MIQLPQNDDPQQPPPQPQPQIRIWNKVILFCIYLMNGTTMNILYTLPYTYEELPTYNILSFFALVCLIPSFRFLITPLIQNHTSLSYGKRKTWLIISTISVSCILFISSYFTHQSNQIKLGLILILQNLFLGCNMTSIDALALKEYKQRSRISFLQSTIHKMGSILGGLVFLKLISKTFCLNFGRTQPLLTVKQYFTIIAVLFFILGVVSHFVYVEKSENAEVTIMHKHYGDLMRQYKIFFNLDYKYPRFLIFYFCAYEGFACFTSGWRYQLVKNLGYDRQNMITITTFMLFLVTPMSYFFSRNIDPNTIARKYQIVLIIKWLNDLVCFFYRPNTTFPLFLYYLCGDNIKECQNILVNTMMNNLSNVGLSAMFLSAAASCRKAMQNHAWSLKLIDLFGFDMPCSVGFIQTLGTIYCVPKLIGWVSEGGEPQEVKEDEEWEEKEREREEKKRTGGL